MPSLHRIAASALLFFTLAGAACEIVAGVSSTVPVACTPEETQSCYSGPEGTEGIGVCKAGTAVCEEDGSTLGVCVEEVLPSAEDCSNELDDDCSGFACAQAIWARSFDVQGDQDTQLLNSTAVDSKGNIYIAGYFEGTAEIGSGQLVGDGARSLYIAKITPDGTGVWSKAYGTGQLGKIAPLQVTPDDRLVIAVDAGNGSVDLGKGSMGPGGTVVALLAEGGEAEWVRYFDADVGIRGLAVDPATSDVILAGSFSGTMDFGDGEVLGSQGDSTDVFVVRLDPSGATRWARGFGDEDAAATATQEAWGLAVSESGNIVVSGVFSGAMVLDASILTADGDAAIFLAGLDGEGTTVWANKMGDAKTLLVTPFALRVSKAGPIFVGGSFQGEISFGGFPKQTAAGDPGNAFIAKFDDKGKFVWDRTIGEAGIQYVFDVSPDAAGDVIVGGAFTGTVDLGSGPVTSAGDTDVFLLKYAANGEPLWSRARGSVASFQLASSVTIDPRDGAIIVSGPNNGQLDFGGDPVVAKTDIDLFVAKIAP